MIFQKYYIKIKQAHNKSAFNELENKNKTTNEGLGTVNNNLGDNYNFTLNSNAVHEEVMNNTRMSNKSKKADKSMNEVIEKMDDQEKLFKIQVKIIINLQINNLKDELKEIKGERDFYKKKLDEITSFGSGDKQEMISMLKECFKNLLAEITVKYFIFLMFQ